MRRLEGRTVVITGAAGGIGAALARAFAGAGCNLALGDLRVDGLEEVAEIALRDADSTITTHHVDVSSSESMARFRDEVVHHHGGAHVLVNNAGITIYGPFASHTLEETERIVGVNLWGVVHGCREFLPVLRAQDEAHIVNMSSLAGYVGIPFQSMYCATKAAVRGLSQALRAELRGSGVGVTSVHPGAVRTNLLGTAASHDREMSDKMAALMMRHALRPEVAARRIVRAVRRDRGEVRMCAESHATYLALRIWPGLVTWALGRGAGYGHRHMEGAGGGGAK